MRALEPTRTGTVSRDDVDIYYEVDENAGLTPVRHPVVVDQAIEEFVRRRLERV